MKVACTGNEYDKVDGKDVKVLREEYTIYCINNQIVIYDNEGNHLGNNTSKINKCYNTARPTTVITKESCGGHGNIMKVGFYVSAFIFTFMLLPTPEIEGHWREYLCKY